MNDIYTTELLGLGSTLTESTVYKGLHRVGI